jgi:hypothetical protein
MSEFAKTLGPSFTCCKIKILSQKIATVDCTVASTVAKFQNLAHCDGFDQIVATQVSQSDNFLVVNRSLLMVFRIGNRPLIIIKSASFAVSN